VAGVPDLLFHDLRRTAARNLRNAGVAEGVIMKIGGWRTRSVFERYAIVAQSDIEEALRKLDSQSNQQRTDMASPAAETSPEDVIQ
jgi:integrase